MRAFFLEFLGRAGCHLCDEAEPLVRRSARLVGADLVRRDIDQDRGLSREYGSRIPVVLGPSGRVLAEGRIQPGGLLPAILVERIRFSALRLLR